MLQNVNTMQKLAYMPGEPGKNLQTYSDLFIKEALANLGQRFSVKGDGVSVSQFKLVELFNGKDLPEPTETNMQTYAYNAYIEAKVSKEKCNIIIHNLGAELSPETNEVITYFENTLSGAPTISLINEDKYENNNSYIAIRGAKVKSVTKPKENIYYYAKNGIILKKDNVFTTAFLCTNANHTPLEISVEQFDDNNKKLLKAVKIYPYNRKFLAATYIEYVGGEDKVDVGKVQQFIFNEPNLTLEYIFENYIKSNALASSDYNPQILIDILLGGKNEDGEYNTEHALISSQIKYYDEDSNLFDYVDADYSHELGEYLLDTINAVNDWGIDVKTADLLESAVNTFNEDIKIFFPYIIKFYNEEKYFTDNVGLKTAIVREFLQQLYHDYLADSEGDNKQDYELHVYFPYNYEFIYSCNSNNMQQIFESVQDITVEAVPTLIDRNTNELEKIIYSGGYNEQLVIVNAQDVTDSTEKIFSIYRFSVSYTEEDNVEHICVRRWYILPYINDDGYWTINNIDTDIYARGKDGGQPSVIMTYTDSSLDENYANTILSTLKKDELTTAIKWEPTYYWVRPLNFTGNINSALHHTFVTYMPTNISYLNENLVTFLENAILLNINSVHSEVHELVNPDFAGNPNVSTQDKPLADSSQLGENGVVCTFWAMVRNNETKNYEFTYVKQPNTDWALDFNYLADIEGLVRFYMSFAINPDEHYHRWLVFTAAKGSLKQQATSARELEACPVIINRDASSSADIFMMTSDTGSDDALNGSGESSEADILYRNNLNWTPAFFLKSAIDEEQGRIKGVDDNNGEKRFFYLDSDGRLPVAFDGLSETYTYAWAQAQAYPMGICPNVEFGYNHPFEGTPDEGITSTYQHTNNRTEDLDKGAYEWYPNTLYENIRNHLTTMLPVFDLKELFIRNFNVLNRANILSTDENGYMYYSYYGTSFSNPDKTIMHLGTERHDINLGLNTLTDADTRQHFNKQHELDIDFDEICLNGDVTFRKNHWSLYKHPDHQKELKMWSTLSELCWIGEDVPVVESFDDAHTNKYNYFTIPETVAYSVSHTDIPSKNSDGPFATTDNIKYISYVDLNWWFDYQMEIYGCNLSYWSDNSDKVHVSGDKSALVKYTYTYNGSELHNWYLRLTTYLPDNAERLNETTYTAKEVDGTEIGSYYYYKCNPLNISYTVVDKDTINEQIYINVRETETNNSTAYTRYHGGDLFATFGTDYAII